MDNYDLAMWQAPFEWVSFLLHQKVW